MVSAALKAALDKALAKVAKIDDLKRLIEYLEAILGCLKLLNIERLGDNAEAAAIDCLESVANSER